MTYGQGHGGITGVADVTDERDATRRPAPDNVPSVARLPQAPPVPSDPRAPQTPQARAGARPLGPRSLLLLLAMLAGLALAALCLHAGGAVGLDGTGPLHAEWLLVMLVVAAGGWYLTAKYHARQNERPMGTAREGRLVTLTVTALVLTILGTSIGVGVFGMGGAKPPPPPPPPSNPPKVPPSPKYPDIGTPPGDASHFRMPHLISIPYVLLVLLVLAVLVLLVLVVIAAQRYLHRRATPAPELVGTLEPAPEEAALTAAVSAGRLALHGEDVRAAVIACYAAMEDSLAASGLGRRASDSPADLLQRAGAAGLLVGLAPQQLAELFREARYSSHPMTRAQLTRARQALDDIGTLLAERSAARAAEHAAAEAAAVAAAGGNSDEVPVR